MRKWIGAVTVSLLVATAVPSFSQATQQPFRDVPASHWAAQAIAELTQAGVFEGYPGAQFNGTRPMTRYEVAMALARLLDAVRSGTGGPTIDQIRNLIMTDPEVQARLRGPQGERGPAGTAGGGSVNADQLRTLILNDPQLRQALTGPQGPQGIPGPPGQPGAAAAPQLTQQQIADLTRLLSEFGPTISAIRNDYSDLKNRVTAVESAVTKISPIRASVDGGVRFGLQGTSLEWGSDATTTAQNATIAATAGTVPTATTDPSLGKDALKGTRYGVYLTDLNLDGTLADGVAAHATARAITPITTAGGTAPNNYPYEPVSSPEFIGVPTYSDNVQMWDWYATFSPNIFGHDYAVTAGRHTNTLAQGLLVDTGRQPLIGVSLDAGYGAFTFGGNGSTIDRTISDVTGGTTVAGPQDTFAYAYLGWSAKSIALVGGYVPSAYAAERGWNVAGEATIFKRRIFAEYAQELRNAAGVKPGTDRTAFVVGADLLNSWHNFSLTARYGQIAPLYRMNLSALYPYAAVNAYDTNWIDRPLFLDPSNVTRGWEGVARYTFGSDWVINVRAYTGRKDFVGGATDADAAGFIQVKKQLSPGLAADLLYGQRQEKTIAPDEPDYKVLRAGIEFAL